MNIGKFKISHRRGEILDWSFGIVIALTLLKFFENFGNKISESTEVLSVGVNSVAQDETLQVLLYFGISVCSLCMWEQLRHALQKAGCFWLQLTQIVIMVLTAFKAIVAVLPSGGMVRQGGALVPDMLMTLQMRLPFIVFLFVFIANILLSVGLVKNFKGAVRRYGLALFFIPVLDMALEWLFGYMYENAGGLTFSDLETYRTLMVVGQFFLGIGLFTFLRFSFTTDDDFEAEDENIDLCKCKQE